MEKPRKNPVQRRSQGTVGAILEAFTHIFEKRGPNEATTNHIAEKAGVSIGSLYQYFPNKHSILVAAIRKLSKERFERLEAIRNSIQGKSIDAVVGEMVDAVVDLRARDRGFEKVLIENLSHYKVLETLKEQQDRFVLLCSECLELLEYPGTEDSRNEAARFLYHTAFSLSVWVGYFDDSIGVDQLKLNLKRILLGYLKNTPSY